MVNGQEYKETRVLRESLNLAESVSADDGSGLCRCFGLCYLLALRRRLLVLVVVTG